MCERNDASSSGNRHRVGSSPRRPTSRTFIGRFDARDGGRKVTRQGMRPQSELGKVRKRREKDPQLRSRRRREYRRDRKCNTAGTMNTPFASSMLREAVDRRRERNSRPDRDGRKFDSEADIDDTRRQAVTDSNRSGRKSANSAPCCREPTIAATCPSHVCRREFPAALDGCSVLSSSEPQATPRTFRPTDAVCRRLQHGRRLSVA